MAISEAISRRSYCAVGFINLMKAQSSIVLGDSPKRFAHKTKSSMRIYYCGFSGLPVFQKAFFLAIITVSESLVVLISGLVTKNR